MGRGVKGEREMEAAALSGGKAQARGGRWRARCLRLGGRLPALRWALGYGRADAAADVVAGLTLGLTLVPQSIAYAALADLPVQYGLYSSFVGTMLYAALGTVKEVSIGPTSLTSLLTLRACAGLPLHYVVLLTFLCGCIVFAMGLLRLGFLVDLISPAVTSGFTSATAVVIVAAQLKGLLGLSFSAESALDNLLGAARRWQGVRAGDASLGLVCCAALLLLRKAKDLPVSVKRVRVRRALWLVGISRNALVVLSAAVLAYCTSDDHQSHHPLFKLSGHVAPGLPMPAPPPFSVPGGNGTEPVDFVHMVQQLGTALLVLPLVMVLANIAIAKAFTVGGRVDATQEMLTLGLCNMAGALVHSMPTCGAFTRSAVSHASGVRTPLAGLYSGIITLLALGFMTKYFSFIPKASLAAVLICAVIFMIDFASVRQLWREDKTEVGVLGLTFLVGVAWSVEAALLSGALAAMGRLGHALMRPRMVLEEHKEAAGAECVVARPALALVYANAEHVCERLAEAAARAAPQALLIDCGQLSLVDHAATQALGRLAAKLKENEQQLIAFNAEGECLRRLSALPGLRAGALRARCVTQALKTTEHAADTASTHIPIT